ncbi:hypothetical protein Dimus_027038, partial [Dionaea muscipula]
YCPCSISSVHRTVGATTRRPSPPRIQLVAIGLFAGSASRGARSRLGSRETGRGSLRE